MADVEIITERETGHGWEHAVALTRQGKRSEHTVRLSWADHEHWSGGRDAPSKVVERLLGLLIQREATQGKEGAATPVPERFDAATVRRWWPGVDEAMRRGWGGGA